MSQKEKTLYTKQQFLDSGRFTPLQKDVLNALLDGDKTYSPTDVDHMLDKFLKGEVG